MTDHTTGTPVTPDNVFDIDPTRRAREAVEVAEELLSRANDHYVSCSHAGIDNKTIVAARVARNAAKDKLAAAKRVLKDVVKAQRKGGTSDNPEMHKAADPNPGAVAGAVLLEIAEKQEEVDALDRLYTNSGAIVRLIDRGTKRSVLAIEGAPLNHVIAKASQHSGFYTTTQEGMVKVMCPEHLAKTMIADGGTGLPTLWGVNDTPVLSEKGNVVMEHGYSAETKLYLSLGDAYYQPCPEHPTREQALTALAQLKYPFEEFPLEHDGQMSVILSMILSVLARPMILRSPLHLVDASQAGSGKTFIAQGVERIVTRNPQGYVRALSWSEKEEEQTKLLVSAAQAGARVVRIENLSPTVGLGGAVLDGAVTEEGWQGRVLQVSKFSQPLDATIYATGNNVEVLADAFRRVVRCRVVPTVAEQFKRTDFRIKDLMGYITDNHSRLLMCALTVLRAVVANDPQDVPYKQRTDHFRAWSDVVARALVWLGQQDPNDYFVSEAKAGDQELPATTVAQLALIEAIAAGSNSVQKINELLRGMSPMTDTVRDAIKTLAPDRKDMDSLTIRSAMRKALGVVRDPISGVDIKIDGYAQNAATRCYVVVLGDAPEVTKDNAERLDQECRAARGVS